MAEVIVKLGDTIVQRYRIEKDVVSIGRARDNDIVVENLSVSRAHSRIRFQDGKYILTDLNSANGSFVNGVKVSKTELADEDIVSIGKHKLYFFNRTDENAEPMAAAPERQESDGPVAVTSAPSEAGGDKPGAEGNQVALVVTRGKQANQIFRMSQPEIFIGRANENDIRLHDWFVSKKHSVIIRSGSGWIIKDLGSWRGTTVNGSLVKESPLNDGDEIVFGTTVIKFRLGLPEDAELRADIPEEVPEDMAAGRTAGIPLANDEDSELVGYEGMDAHDGLSIEVEEDEDEEQSGTQEVGDVVKLDDDSIEIAVENNTSEVEVADFVDDDFSPLTEDELAALEEEADDIFNVSEQELKQAEFEQLEAERMFAEGGGLEMRAGDELLEDEEQAQAEEEDFVQNQVPDVEENYDEEVEDLVEIEDKEEEEALFGGPVVNHEPGSKPDGQVATKSEKKAPQKSKTTLEVEVPEGVDPKEIRIWARGLKNRSSIIRKEAARKLKELTGVEYDWESEPE